MQFNQEEGGYADRTLKTLVQRTGDTMSLDQVCSKLPGPSDGLSETGRWVVKGLELMKYEFLNGIVWPTYVDLEVFWVMEQLLHSEIGNEDVIEVMLEQAGDVNRDTTKFGLVGKINELQAGLLEELPIAKRLRLLRFILKGCANRPTRLRGIANPVVCIPPSLQSEAEAQFASLQARIKREGVLTSLFKPMKYHEDLSATLALVESEIQSEQARGSS